jgi:hypothetical protein
VISPDIAIQDIDVRQWDRWFRLLMPPGVRSERTWAAVIVEGEQVVRALRSGRGALPADQVPFSGTSPEALAALRKALGVGGVFVIERDALAQFLADVEQNLSVHDDFMAQWLRFARGLKWLWGAGFWADPPFLDLIPIPPTEAIQRGFDLLIPDDTSVLLYVFESDESDVAASAIARKRHGDIDFVATHLHFADAIDPRELAGAWQGAYRRVLALAQERLAPPSIGVFLRADTLERLQSGGPDQLAREVQARELILDPSPVWLTGLVGATAAAAAAARGARALARFVPPGAKKFASDFAQSAQDRLRDAGANPFAALGFDPIETWLRLKEYYRG